MDNPDMEVLDLLKGLKGKTVDEAPIRKVGLEDRKRGEGDVSVLLDTHHS